jgi:diguanylate cyclase (GGDEF)-like protein
MDSQIFRTILDKQAQLYPALAGLVGCLVGWLIARLAALSKARRRARADSLDKDRDIESRDLRKTVYLLQNENTKLSTFLMTLPDLARQLNSNLEKRKIPHLLIIFIEALFDAEQILIFLTTPDGKHLVLSDQKGLSDSTRRQAVIPFGEGRVGWVAWHQITMDESDFNQKSRVSKSDLSGQVQPAFKTELCAPMVSKDQTLGVISIGGLLRRPKNEKNMLRMVADLGSIAIKNTSLINTIQASADTDGLTGLANKTHFKARLAEEILKADKEQKSLSLFLFDIDHFKTYNDTNGHPAGDEALRITGRLLSETVRQEDFAARYGGEEFVVLFPNTDKQGAAAAAENIRRTIEQYAYPQEQSQPNGRLTISGGVASFPYDANTGPDLVRFADQALYKAKHDGRNRVCLHEPKFLSDETGAGEIKLRGDKLGITGKS